MANKSDLQKVYDRAMRGGPAGDVPEELMGLAIPPVAKRYATVEQCAALVRWQAALIFGGWDTDAIAETLALIGRHVVVIDAEKYVKVEA